MNHQQIVEKRQLNRTSLTMCRLLSWH